MIYPFVHSHILMYFCKKIHSILNSPDLEKCSKCGFPQPLCYWVEMYLLLTEPRNSRYDWFLRENCPPFRVNKVESRAKRLHFHFLVQLLKRELPSTSIALLRNFIFSLIEESTVSRPKEKNKAIQGKWVKDISTLMFLKTAISLPFSVSLCLLFCLLLSHLYFYQQSIIVSWINIVIGKGVSYKWQEKNRGTEQNEL